MERREPSAASERPSADRHGIRAKELYKYYKPSTSNSPSRFTEPDTILTAHVQLVACRLNANRAIISLVDRDVQHFIAESTQTSPINQPSVGDDISTAWLRCTTTPRAGRLCEKVIEATPPASGGPPFFEVTDLSVDPRFKDLPFIYNETKFRYYCGVPITTAKGINIGSLFIVDDKPRPQISDAGRTFMGSIATNVMIHLELIRDQLDKRRALNMNMCLAAFVDPEYASRKRKREISPGKTTKIQLLAKESLASPTTLQPMEFPVSRSPALGPTRVHSSEIIETIRDTMPDTDQNVKIDDGEHLNAYKRASNLLFESLSLEGGGGVTFMLDASGGAHMHSHTASATSTVEHTAANVTPDTKSALASPSPRTPKEPFFGHHPGEGCEVLASFTSDGPALSAAKEAFEPLSSSELAKLIRKYPRGKLFTLDPELLSSTPSGDETTPQTSDDQFGRTARSRTSSVTGPMDSTEMLAQHFPRARQVLFIPLWDALSDRWAPCFIYNTNPYRTLSRATDFLHAIAFCNCVQTELSKLATMNADHQKQTFIGSISHELRSPLHGILGSMEFLNDTDCTAFQHSLIDTANSCAVTLLDTISMVLDYSKLNNLERNASRARPGRRGQSGADKTSLLHPSLNIYGFVDLSVITEEVVEGVATGQEFKHIGKFDTADVALPARSKSVRGHGADTSSIRRADVEILVDIKPRASWEFVTQPGAFRRIVMNLFGNALKYTQRGHIKVTLESLPMPTEQTSGAGEDSASSIVRLTITDTGQGISPQFMRSKLFTPFSQENTLNPGTGLGLSLVKEIVTMLDGDISMRSEVGVGTEVIVSLPMTENSPAGSGDTIASAPASAASAGSLIDRGKDDSMATIREMAETRSFAFFWRENPEDTPKQSASAQILRQCIKGYFTNWYGFSPLGIQQPISEADIIVVDEVDLAVLLSTQQKASGTRAPSLFIVLCTNSSRHASVKAYAAAGTLEFVSLPVGPFKLARAIKLGFDKMHATPTSMHFTSGTQADRKASLEPVIESLERVTLSLTTPGGIDVNVLQHGSTLAREDSTNAQMAMDRSYGSSGTSGSEEAAEGFPFPSESSKPKPGQDEGKQRERPVRTPLRPPLSPRQTKDVHALAAQAIRPAPKRALSAAELATYETTAASPLSTPGVQTNAKGATIGDAAKTDFTHSDPRLLLVDDNKVNLRLLQAYMNKRKIAPANVSTAEDGQQAVSVFADLLGLNPPRPPHIVFMDLSMPIMDGFAATRQIRELETQYGADLMPNERPPPALIIALTGLASSRDQSEAFVSGFDLYMTKPVSFKEVGRLLDNWTANGGARMPDSRSPVPYGAVSGESPVPAENLHT